MIDNELFTVVNGSKLYGTDNPDSDDDYISVFVEPPETVFSHKSTKTKNLSEKAEGERSGPGEVDGIAYPLRHYLSLLVKGNPSILCTVNAPETAIVSGRGLYKLLFEDPTIYASKQSGPRFMGYLYNQYERFTGIKTGHIPNRPELVARYGFDTKYASQTVRLGLQGIELLSTGRLTLPMKESEATLCKDIRNGFISYDATVIIIEDLIKELKVLVKKNSLPEEPDYARIYRISREVHEYHWENQL